MIFAEIECDKDIEQLHAELSYLLHYRFSRVKSGLQLDSWFFIQDGAEGVMVDTFFSTRHQIKSVVPGAHVQSVVEVLSSKYKIRQFDPPAHEVPEQW